MGDRLKCGELMPDVATLSELIQTGGVVSLLLTFIVGGIRRWWVWGWQYDDLRKSHDEWKTIALAGSNLSRRAVEIVERGVSDARTRS